MCERLGTLVPALVGEEAYEHPSPFPLLSGYSLCKRSLRLHPRRARVCCIGVAVRCCADSPGWVRMDVMEPGNTEDGMPLPGVQPARVFRVEHRIAEADPIVLATVRNVFAHHDTLTQYVSRLLTERGDGDLSGELVLIDEATGVVLARRDLYRAGQDARKGRRRPR